MLLAEMVENVDYKRGTSKIEVAFDLLVLRGLSDKEPKVSISIVDDFI